MSGTYTYKSYLNVDGTTYAIRDPEAAHASDINTFLQDATVKAALLDFIHPVGSLYISDDPTDPATLFGGTWSQIKDKFILAAGDSHAALSEGGYEDASVISHTHTITSSCDNSGSHVHSFTGTTVNAGAHQHSAGSGYYYSLYKGTRSSEQIGGISGTGWYISQVAKATGSGWTGIPSTYGAGDHTHSFSGVISSSGAHSHTITSTASTVGVSGTGRNMPPYHTSYVWKRVA